MCIRDRCSATQIVPEVAKEAKHVTQFVRSKHWYAPLPDAAFAKTDWFRWLLTNVPWLMWLLRAYIWYMLESDFCMATGSKRGQEKREEWERVCRDYVTRTAPEKYHEQLIPSNNELMVACRRRILDNAYLPCLNWETVSYTHLTLPTKLL